MILDRLGRQAKSHWKEFLPKRYARLEKEGSLTKALFEAQEKTHDELQSLIRDGLPYNQAWELVREKYLLLPPEKGL